MNDLQNQQQFSNLHPINMVEKNRAIEILEELRSRIWSLMCPPGAASPEFTKWHCDVEAAISHIFPDRKRYLDRITEIAFKQSAYSSAAGTLEEQRSLRDGLAKAEAVLQSLIEEVKTFWKEDGTPLNPQATQPAASISPACADPRVVFVVHGRNELMRKSIFDFLRAIGLRPLEWSQALSSTGEATPYIGTILDSAFSKAQAVVVLMTPDDEARLRKEFHSEHDEQYEKDLTGQARPNVLIEAGMALGRDSKRTVLVQIGSLRPFSDVAGRHVLRLDNSSERRQDLAERLKTAGCPVDLTGRDWHKIGSFALAESVATPSS